MPSVETPPLGCAANSLGSALTNASSVGVDGEVCVAREEGAAGLAQVSPVGTRGDVTALGGRGWGEGKSDPGMELVEMQYGVHRDERGDPRSKVVEMFVVGHPDGHECARLERGRRGRRGRPSLRASRASRQRSAAHEGDGVEIATGFGRAEHDKIDSMRGAVEHERSAETSAKHGAALEAANVQAAVIIQRWRRARRVVKRRESGIEAEWDRPRVKGRWCGLTGARRGSIDAHVACLQWLFRSSVALVPGAWGRGKQPRWLVALLLGVCLRRRRFHCQGGSGE